MSTFLLTARWYARGADQERAVVSIRVQDPEDDDLGSWVEKTLLPGVHPTAPQVRYVLCPAPETRGKVYELQDAKAFLLGALSACPGLSWYEIARNS